MSRPGLHVNDATLEERARAIPAVSAAVGEVGSGPLAVAAAVGDGTFGRVGAELGLPDAFRSAVQRAERTLAAIRGQIDQSGSNLHTAAAGYEAQEHDHVTTFTRAGRLEEIDD